MLLLKDLTVEFPTPEGTARAVDMVNLEVKEKEKVAIIGETGSGKSVLLLALLRLLPSSACITGAVWLAGKDLPALPEAELQRIRGRRAAYVPQGAGDGYAPAHAGFKELGCRFYERCPKAFDICRQEPPLVEKDSRQVRCWLYA